MVGIFHALFGRFTPYIVLGLLGIVLAIIVIFGLNIGTPTTS